MFLKFEPQSNEDAS